VLEFDDLVLAEITDIGDTRLSAWFDHHPANVTPVQTLVRIVRVKVCVSVSVVSPMTSGPPLDRSFNRTSASKCKEVLQRLRSIVGTMSPKTVVTRRDTYRRVNISQR
jgi:hypothetical protein